MLADAHGTWFQALGEVWFHSDTEGSRQLTVNVPEEMIAPAGPLPVIFWPRSTFK
jgi:hypothetical protein